MKTIRSKLFESEVHIIGDYEARPTGTWFRESEVTAMKKWDDETKRLFFRVKQVFGSESGLVQS